MKVWAVITEDGLDAVWQTEAQAKREAKDLKGMGLDKVKVKAFDSEADAYDWEDRRRGIL